MSRALIPVYLAATALFVWAAVQYPDFRWLYILVAVLAVGRAARLVRRHSTGGSAPSGPS